MGNLVNGNIYQVTNLPSYQLLFEEIVWDDLRRALCAACEWRRETENPRQPSLPVVIGSGSHPFPFRTRKLSLIPPMVLHGKLCGRVGRCRHYSVNARGLRFAG